MFLNILEYELSGLGYYVYFELYSFFVYFLWIKTHICINLMICGHHYDEIDLS